MKNPNWELITDMGITFIFQHKKNPNITINIECYKGEQEAWELLNEVAVVTA